MRGSSADKINSYVSTDSWGFNSEVEHRCSSEELVRGKGVSNQRAAINLFPLSSVNCSCHQSSLGSLECVSCNRCGGVILLNLILSGYELGASKAYLSEDTG